MVLLLCAFPAFAQIGDTTYRLRDPEQEQRAREIGKELRCLVCQNQSIDDSDAPLARDLRQIVRERLKAGASDTEVRDYLVERYGAFVLLRPPFGWSTALLWTAPFILLGFGGAMLFAQARRRRPAAPPPLSAEERAALDRLAGPPA
jgi:cytochrome c-type biogenesis protein CcmH